MSSIVQANQQSLSEIAGFASVLSLIGCIFIFWSYCTIKDLRKMTAFRMVFHLALADFFLTVNGLINVNAGDVDHEFCAVWAYFREHMALTSVLWPFVFAHTMHCFYNGRYKSQADLSKRFKYYAMFCWLGPILVSVIPIFFNAYGSGAIYCWLWTDNHDLPVELIFMLSMIVFYGPITIIILFMVGYYINILRHMMKNPSTESKSAIYSLFFYPVAFFITYAFAAGDRFINLEFKGEYVWLLKGHILLQQTQGFLNAVIYGCSGKVREQIKNHFDKKKKDRSTKMEELFKLPESLTANSYLQSSYTTSSYKSNAKSPLTSSIP